MPGLHMRGSGTARLCIDQEVIPDFGSCNGCGSNTKAAESNDEAAVAGVRSVMYTLL